MGDERFNDDELPSGLYEELRIMDERARSGQHVSADTLQEPTGELCTRRVETADVNATVRECVDVMRAANFGAVVITREGKLAGILTERDLLRTALTREDDWLSMPVSDFMTKNPDSLRKDDPMVFVMNRMHVGGYRHVPIVDENDVPTHIVSIRDVLRFLLSHFEDEVSNIPPEPYRGPPKRYGG